MSSQWHIAACRQHQIILTVKISIYFFFFRDCRFDRRRTGRNAARSSAVHPWRLRQRTPSPSADQIRSAPLDVTGSQIRQTVDCREAVLPRDHRRYTHPAAAGRHVLDGEKLLPTAFHQLMDLTRNRIEIRFT